MKVMIIGAGKLGYKVAELMLSNNIDVTVIDSDAKVIERIKEHLDVLAVNASGLEFETLKELGIANYDLVIATTESDETNAIISSLAKKMGSPRTVARIRNPEYFSQIAFIKNEMGIDQIVSPDLAIANVISRYLLKTFSFHVENYAKGKVQLLDLPVSQLPHFINKQIMDISGIEGLLIVAIKRDGKIIIPDGKTVIEENDIIYLIGNSEMIRQLEEEKGINLAKSHTKNVMIFGGGKVGYNVAVQLMQAKMDLTIIEQNRERCNYLSQHLEKALIVHGDGTDINLLEDENLANMDVFIGATDFDEQNLLMSLMAKQTGAKKVIAKVSRPNYTQIIDKLGIDIALNPIDITASEILKFFRGGKLVSVSLLLGGQAEVVEVIIDKNLKIVNKKIKDMNLPKGIIIGSIVRSGRVYIPNGDTIIHENDRLIIFFLETNINALDIFIKPSKGVSIRELFRHH